MFALLRWTPDQQRIAARCAASGARRPASHKAARHQRPAVDQHEEDQLEGSAWYTSALELRTDSNPTSRQVRRLPKSRRRYNLYRALFARTAPGIRPGEIWIDHALGVAARRRCGARDSRKKLPTERRTAASLRVRPLDCGRLDLRTRALIPRPSP